MSMVAKKLEQYKYFQPIAWTLCISFAGFVAMLTIELRNVVYNMQNSSLSLEARIANIEDRVGITPQ